MATVVHEIMISEDVGEYEPSYRKVKLSLWDDSTVTWSDWTEGSTER